MGVARGRSGALPTEVIDQHPCDKTERKMKLYFCLLAVFLSIVGRAEVPDVVITTLMSANGHATVAGRLQSKPEGPVGISVRNGNIVYSTITDSEGRWGIVIRHLSTQVAASSWNLSNSLERGTEVSADSMVSLRE